MGTPSRYATCSGKCKEGKITKEKRDSEQGFTLAELLIVVAIIGILVSVSIPIFTKQLEKSREAVDLANLRSAYAAAVYNGQMTEFTTTKPDGTDPRTWTWEGSYVCENGVPKQQPFFYDPVSGKMYHACPDKPCGKGTAADGGTKPTFFGKGEYRGNADVTKANIVIYYESNQIDKGEISVYFGYPDGTAVIQHPKQ